MSSPEHKSYEDFRESAIDEVEMAATEGCGCFPAEGRTNGDRTESRSPVRHMAVGKIREIQCAGTTTTTRPEEDGALTDGLREELGQQRRYGRASDLPWTSFDVVVNLKRRKKSLL